MSDIELTILLPCLNEAVTLASCITKAKQFLINENIHGEILVADNGSTDGSCDIAVANGARVIHVNTKGYGAALNAGIQAAKGKYIIMGDADASYDFLNLTPFLTKLRDGFDLVMGNRFKGGIHEGAMPFLNKYLGNPVLSLLGRLFFKTPIGDFHSGLRGFRRASMLNLHLQSQGMEFASEMVAQATLHQLKITEVPIELFPDGRNRRPHLRPWRDGWRHLRLLLLMSPNWLFLYPGISLIIVGVCAMLLLINGPFTIGRLNFDVHTLLFSGLFIIVGLQAIFFSLFCRLLAAFYTRFSLPAPNLQKFLQQFTLERGLVIGLILVIMGCLGSVYAFWYWMHQAFGPLIPAQLMRVLIPSFTALISGMQIVFASFFVSVLQLYYRYQ